MATDLQVRPWMAKLLILAGVYNLVWGTLAVCLPMQMLSWLGVNPLPTYPQFWQCIGMIVGVFGVGYLIAARDPYRHWPLTLVGLLGKVLGPIGFVASIGTGSLPVEMGWTILANDLAWWIPFAMILWGAVRFHQSVGSAYQMPEADDPLRDLRLNTGQRLDELADAQPKLVVFLRHAGCTFCRESLADIAEQRARIESRGCGIVLVHMGDNVRDAALFEKHGLADVPRLADPDCRLYRQFGLDMGGFSELLGPLVWVRGFMAGLVRGHGVGRLRGNGFQMPGVYLYHCGQILGGFQHARASDRPDYAELACQLPQPT
ncbi:MAG: peroxiredoxin [Porticoccaceae bacterium]|jgi:peroxiredoxin